MRTAIAGPRLRTSLPQVYAAAAVRMALPLFVLPLVAARLGAAEFGRLGFILVWSALLAALVEGGFLAAATRLAVGADAAARRRLARQVFTARVALSAPALALAFAAVAFGFPDSAHPLGDSLAIGALACAFGWPATWYLQATQQLHRWSRVEVVVYAALIAGCLAFAHSVAAYVLLQLAASSMLAVLGWRWLREDLRGPAGLALYAPGELRAGLRLGARMLPVSIAGAAYSVALPAAASAALPKAELGVYFMADRVVRAVLAAADPVYSLVYPRIVAAFAGGARGALWLAARWAAAATVAGAIAYAAAAFAWQSAAPLLAARAGDLDLARVRDVAAVLAVLWPLLFGWKFFGYWMLGSGRHDHAYRASMIAGGVAGVAGAATVGAAHGALGLAWTAIGVELVVIGVAVGAMAAGRALRTAPR